ncbi:hypothetical protein LCGC14_0975440 [marine sediment metagenome]|uniref:SMODS-associated and fused to various effectors domain-containing protein n=1 Tax=marine sediment metagenome TaxID=412755 RepID=A0A0F9NEV8_9ZZZZ
MTNRKYPTYTTKIKIAVDHGGKCAFCGIESNRLYPNLQGEQLIGVRVGKFAHIHSENENGPRFDPNISEEDLASRLNFLYLCEDHHSLIDDNEDMYKAEDLKSKRKEFCQLVSHNFKKNSIGNKCCIITLEDNFFGKINRTSIIESLGINTTPISNLNISLDLPENDSDIDWLSQCHNLKKKWKNFQEYLFKINGLNLNEIIPDEYHIYSITKIPLAIYFGAILQETNKVLLHQWRRKKDEQTWVWNQEDVKGEASNNILISCPEGSLIKDSNPVILKIEISAKIDNKSIEQLIIPMNNLYSLSVKNPSVNWLQSLNQLHLVCREYRRLFEKITEIHKNSEINLFYAGPIPVAIFLGQIFNPRIYPPLVIYNWQKNENNLNEFKKVFGLGELL